MAAPIGVKAKHDMDFKDAGHNKMAPYNWSEVVEKEKSTKVKKKRSPEERKQRKAEKERLRGQMDLSHVEQEFVGYNGESLITPGQCQGKITMARDRKNVGGRGYHACNPEDSWNDYSACNEREPPDGYQEYRINY